MTPRQPRRILFVCHAYLPDSHAGVEVYTARLASGLRATGRWEVAVLTARKRPGRAQNSVECGEVDGIRTYELVQNYPYRDLPEAVDDPAQDRVFSEIIAAFDPELVSIQTLAGLSVGFLDRCQAAQVPTVLHLHDGWWSCPSGGQRWRSETGPCLPIDRRLCSSCFADYRHLEGPLERGARALATRLPGPLPAHSLHHAFQRLPQPAKRLLRELNEKGARLRFGRPGRQEQTSSTDSKPDLMPAIMARHHRVRSALNGIDQVIAPSRFIAESLQADGLELPKLCIEPTGVPLPTASIARRRDSNIKLLFAGTWVPHKGPQVFARALAAMDPLHFEAGQLSARALGPKPFAAFAKEVLELASGRLEDKGVLAPTEMAAALSSADALIIPSLWAENAPLVVMEALAVGTPVIASRIGGLPELIAEGRDGLLFGPGDHRELADLLSQLSSHPSQLDELSSSLQPPRDLVAFCAAIEGRYLRLCSQQQRASA